MQFDQLDNKFRDAADHHHPPYDEKAWAKMENMLDKHMPVEEKKRRFLFILLLFAGLGAAGLLIWQPWHSPKNNVAANETPVISNPAVQPSLNGQPVPTVTPVSTITPVSTVPPVGKDNLKARAGISNSNNLFPSYISKNNKQRGLTWNKPIMNPGPQKKMGQVSSTPKVELIDNHNSGNKTAAKVAEKILTENNKTVADQKIAGNTIVQNSLVPPKKAERKNEKANPKNKKRSIFFVSLGGGPDISFVNLNRPGTTKLFGGAGLGYTYRERVTLRAGFYSGRKIYSANPEYYNAPATFYAYYPYLQDVDANCKVYEVPLALSYNFTGNSKRQFFASAGVSTYFMKKETYTYHYKTVQAGPTLTKTRTFNDVNKHYFAGLTLSAGYTQTISRGLSITIEPYTKLPLKGVGYGNVKLNSAGVLFSIGLQPFSHLKKIKSF